MVSGVIQYLIRAGQPKYIKSFTAKRLAQMKNRSSRPHGIYVMIWPANDVLKVTACGRKKHVSVVIHATIQ